LDATPANSRSYHHHHMCGYDYYIVQLSSVTINILSLLYEPIIDVTTLFSLSLCCFTPYTFTY
jgi:hypothetical protein